VFDNSRNRLLARSAVIALIALGVSTTPFVAQSQQAPKIFRVAHLSAAGRTPDGLPPAALREALRGLGYVEGRNVVYEARFSGGKSELLPGLAAELVRLKVDAIVAQGGAAARAAKQATSTIPIITAPAAGDNVATGLIASLARPGGNITGLTDELVQLSAKRMEILKEAVPKAALIAVLWNAGDEGMTLRYREIEKAARVLKVEVQPLGVRAPEDFEGAFSTMVRRRPDAMFLVADFLTSSNRKQLIEFAATHRIPAMYEFSFIVRDGGLMSYGPSFEEGFRKAAVYLDRIFKGARPADLPAEQPERYYLSINLKTAAAAGVTIPPTLLLRTDDVVQ
jgi:putative ABC transport system substrate-binding protein